MNELKKIGKLPEGNKNTINISGAGLKEDNSNTIDFNSPDENYLKNLEDQKVILNSEVGKTNPDATTTVDFLNEEQVNSFTSSKSKVSENKSADSFFSGKTSAQIQEQIKAEEKKSQEVSPETFVEIARFIIFLIDASAAAFFKWWSGDPGDSAYSLSKPKQEQLVRQLATILIKYQAKFSIEFMFLLSVLILYIPAFTMAKTNRKANRAKKPVENPRQQKPTQSNVNKEPVVEIKNRTVVVNNPTSEVFTEQQNVSIENLQQTEQNVETAQEIVYTTVDDLPEKPRKKRTRPVKAN